MTFTPLVAEPSGMGRHRGTVWPSWPKDGPAGKPARASRRRRRHAQPLSRRSGARAVIVGCLYLPNGTPHPGPKFDYKLAWFERLINYAAGLYDSGHPVVLAGDYNVVPTDEDIYNPRSWLKDALLQPESRERYQRLLAQGWID